MVELLSPKSHGSIPITHNWNMTDLPCAFVYKNRYEGNSSYLRIPHQCPRCRVADLRFTSFTVFTACEYELDAFNAH